MRRRLGALLAAGGLAAASPAGAEVELQQIHLTIPTSSGDNLRLRDERPATERNSGQQRVFNLWVITLGDEHLDPSLPAGLKGWLSLNLARMPEQEIVLLSAKIQVETQDVYVNFQPVNAPAQPGVSPGSNFIGYLIGNLIAKTLAEHSAAANQKHLVRLHFAARVADQPVVLDDSQGYRGQVFGPEFVDAVRRGIGRFGQALRASLEPPTPLPVAPATTVAAKP